MGAASPQARRELRLEQLGNAFGLLLTANVENTDSRRDRKVVRQVKLLELGPRYDVETLGGGSVQYLELSIA